MKKTAILYTGLAMFLCLMTACGGASTAGKPADNEEIVFGDEQFEEYLPLLEGKRVALFTNQTGIVGDKVVEEGASDADVTDDANEAGTATAAVTSQVDTSLIPFGKDVEDNDIVYGQHILDALLERGVKIEAVFCPEHGFRGSEDAGAELGDTVDEETAKTVRRKSFTKNYRFGLHGYSNLLSGIVDLGTEKTVTNREGHELVPYFKKLFAARA